jgi:hypothetical protein
MRKTMRRQTERELMGLRSRIAKSEAAGVTVSARAYQLLAKLERQLAADALAQQRLRAFLGLAP